MTTSVTDLAKKLDNLTLKQWLREVGPVRRKEILKKLKGELEELCLPKLRYGIRGGLIQLMSGCSVMVERLPSNSAFDYSDPQDIDLKSEKVTSCSEHDILKKETSLSSTSEKSCCTSINPFFEKDEFLIGRVSGKVSSISSDPQNCCKNNNVNFLSKNSSTRTFSHENLGAEDISFKTQHLPFTHKNFVSFTASHRTKPCPLSHKKLLESDFHECAKSRSVVKKSSFTGNGSPVNNSPVLNNTSENKICPLEKSSVVRISDVNVPVSRTKKDTESSEYSNHCESDKINLNGFLNKRNHSNRENPNTILTLSRKRHFSANDFSDTSTSRKIVARAQRSHSSGENFSLRSTKVTYFEKENLKKECKELTSKIRNLVTNSQSALVEESLDKNSSDKSSICHQSELSERIVPNFLEGEKVAVPVKINLEAIEGLKEVSSFLNDSEKIPNSEGKRNPHITKDNGGNDETEKNTEDLQQAAPLKEKRKIIQNQEDEGSSRKITRLEDVESEKKQKKTVKKKTLKLVFHELFGDDNDEDEVRNIQQNLNNSGINCKTVPERKKVDSRDSCDSGAYCSEASPISIATYSKDVDSSEIFSPDSTEIECRKLRDLEVLKFPNVESEIFHSESEKNANKIDEILQDKTLINFRIINENENLDTLDKNSLKKEINESSVLPDSSTCISDDELTVVDSRSESSETTTIPNVSLQELDDEVIESESPSKSSSNGPSDDTLSKVGIVRDQKKNSYIFSSNDINILLNLLSENPINPAQVNPPRKILDSTEEIQGTKLENKPSLEKSPIATDSSESDIEIVMEKGPSITPNTSISDTREKEKIESVEKPVSEEPPKISFPRLRVKNPSELGCPKWGSAPLSSANSTSGLVNSELNLPPFYQSSNLPTRISSGMWTHPTQEFSTPSTSLSSIPTVLSHNEPTPSQRVENFNSQFNSEPNEVVNLALAAAQRLISLVNPLTIPDVPHLSHYYNKLISLLGDIAKDTKNLRLSYQNRPYGLFSPDLLGYNLSLNRKLRNLAQFLCVAFEENTIQYILNNYHALTTHPVLNNEELQYIISLQCSDLDLHTIALLEQQTQEANQIRSPFSGILQQSNNIDQNMQHSSRIVRTLSPQAPLISAPASQLPQTRKANSNLRENRSIDVFTSEQYIILKSQINAYNTLAKKFQQFLQKEIQKGRVVNEQRRTTDISRPVQQHFNSKQPTRVESSTSVKNSRRIVSTNNTSNETTVASGIAQNSTVVFRMKNTPQGLSAVPERIENQIRNGLTITPISGASSQFHNSASTEPFSLKSVGSSRSSGVTPFSSALTIRAIIASGATPASTPAVSVANQNLSNITPTGSTTVISTNVTFSKTRTVSTSSAISTSTVVSSTITPSVILPSPIVSSANKNPESIRSNSSLPSTTSSASKSPGSSIATSAIVTAPTLSIPIGSAVITSSASSTSALLRTYSRATLSQIQITTTNQKPSSFIRTNSSLSSTISSASKSPGSAIATSAIVSVPTLSVSTASAPIVSAVITSSASSSSVPLQKYSLATLNQTQITTTNQNPSSFNRSNSSVPSTTSSASTSVGSAIMTSAIVPTPIVSLATASSETAASATSGSDHLQRNLLISKGTRVITINPTRTLLQSSSSLSTCNRNEITPAIKSPTTLQSSKKPAIRRTFAASKTTIPNSYLTNRAKKMKNSISQQMKEKLGTKTDLSDSARKANLSDSTTLSSDSANTETGLRSMPSLSPTPNPISEKTDEISAPLNSKSSENAHEDNAANKKEDEEEELLCFRCKKKSTVVCARCQKAIYCSKSCQEKHWETSHHETCQQDSSVESKKST